MIEPLARFGFAPKAFVYLVVGLLAASAALKKGGLLLAIALGLLAYAVDQGLPPRCRRIRSPLA